MPQPMRSATTMGFGHITAKRAHMLTLMNGGGTFTRSGISIKPKYGFSLSLNPERTVIVPVEQFSPTNLTVFSMINQPLIDGYNELYPRVGTKMYGTWVHEGNVHIDIVTVIADRNLERAMHLARENNQIAIYDFATGNVLDVEQYFKAP